MLAHSPSKTACLKLAREKLVEIETQKWCDQLLSDGNSIDNGNKPRTYRKFKTSFNTEPTLK